MRTRKQAKNLEKTKKILGFLLMGLSVALLVLFYILILVNGGFNAFIDISGLGKATFILITVLVGLCLGLMYFGGLYLLINYQVKKPEYKKRAHTANL